MRNKPVRSEGADQASSNEALGVVPVEPGQTLGGASGQPPQSPDMPLVSDNPIISSSTQRHEEADVPPPPTYKVTKGGSIMYAGNRVNIKPGKLMDARAFNLDLVRAQGTKLRSGVRKRKGGKTRARSAIIIVSMDSPALKAVRNIAGVDVVKVSDLSVERLAPGAKAGRLAIYTEAALAEVSKL